MSKGGKLTEKERRFVGAYVRAGSVSMATDECGKARREIPKRGFYVYALVDPFDDEIFYVGKGKGNRARAHAGEIRRGAFGPNEKKRERIAAILGRNAEPEILVLWSGECEADAYQTERETIAAIGLGRLTNQSRGSAAPTPYVKRRAAWLLSRLKPFERWYMEPGRGLLDILRRSDMVRLYREVIDGP